MTKVTLKDIAESLGSACEEGELYLDRSSGEILRVAIEHLEIAENNDHDRDFADWETQLIAEAKTILEDKAGRFIQLPTKFDIHEWSIMERFCHTVQSSDISDELQRAIHGAGAFRYFKDMVDRYGLREQWYRHRHNALEDIARDWCQSKNIDFEN
ncbi:MAG: UPF0158 family protein [Candidatus Obscuribacterales bacterium]|nr:UPF0158 family protein [Candidatus Obscuribacterales bacterium]